MTHIHFKMYSTTIAQIFIVLPIDRLELSKNTLSWYLWGTHIDLFCDKYKWEKN